VGGGGERDHRLGGGTSSKGESSYDTVTRGGERSPVFPIKESSEEKSDSEGEEES